MSRIITTGFRGIKSAIIDLPSISFWDESNIGKGELCVKKKLLLGFFCVPEKTHIFIVVSDIAVSFVTAFPFPHHFLTFFDRLDFLEEPEGSRFADKKILTKMIYRI